MTSPATVERVDFTVRYDGEALREHRMSVRDLAPALLGLADVFQEANETLSPGEPPVTLDIRATDEGSFAVELSVIHQQIVHLLNSPDSVAAATLLGFIAGGAGLFTYLRNKFRQGNVEVQLPDGSARITLPDGTTMEFPAQVLALSRQAAIRRGAQAVVVPLTRDGIDLVELSTREQGASPVRIYSDDVPAINDAANDQHQGPLITDAQYEQVLTVRSPNFQTGNKWRLNDGQATYWMAMDDGDFLGRIDRGEVAFRKDDRLRAQVWLRQWATDDSELHTERSITRVIEHIARPDVVQGRLPLNEEDDRP